MQATMRPTTQHKRINHRRAKPLWEYLEEQQRRDEAALCARHDLAHPPSPGVCQRKGCGRHGLITTYDVCLDCHEEMRRIYNDHVRLAYKLGLKFFTHHPMGVRLSSVDDAHQVALLALWEGAKAFDRSLSLKPITIIYRYIWGRLQSAAESGVIRVASHAFGKDSTPNMLDKAQKASNVSGLVPAVSDNLTAKGDMVADVMREEIRQNVRGLLDKLPHRKAEVIRMRFGIAPYPEPRGLEQIGCKLGISKERVRQIEAVALAELTQLLYETTLGD